jgi:allantoinase
MAKALRSTRVLTPQGIAPAAVIVDHGRIAALANWNEVPSTAELVDFGDLVLLPGLVDSHVHINEPGRTEWEGFATATQAAASGGVTTLVDMPLNCVPETINLPALEAKRNAAQGKAWVDWAAWGGVVRGNAESLPSLAHAGVPGFKCFLIHSGIDGFAWVDEPDLRAALKKLRGTGLPLLAHAEVAGPVDAATESLNKVGADWRKYSTYLRSRPDAAEIEAIALLIRLAEEFQTPIHIVHLSSAQALPLLRDARQRGVPVTVETCAHYLWFEAAEIPDGATQYKCAPPIRDAGNREALWNALNEGLIEMVITDHSPCPPVLKLQAEMRLPARPEYENVAMKTASELAKLMHFPEERIEDLKTALSQAVSDAIEHGQSNINVSLGNETGRWDKAWGGIASLGLALPVLWTGMKQRGIGLERIGEWMAAAPVRLAGMNGRKGVIAVDADADFAVFDPEVKWTVASSDLYFRHKLSPYLGVELQGRVLETWLRGAPVFRAGAHLGKARGKEQVRS